MKTSKSTQLAAFDKVLGLCETFGPGYQPSNEDLMPTALAALLQQGRKSQKAVNDALDASALATIRRAHAFKEIPKFSTRIMETLMLSNVPSEVIQEAVTLKRKLAYRSPKHQKSVASENTNEPVKGNPSVQLSFAAIEENFGRMVAIVLDIEGYKPNESDLQKPALIDCCRNLKALSADALNKHTALIKARRDGKDVMTQLHEVVKHVKRYIRATFGRKSAAYAPFKSIRTTKPI